ncbi:bifunctional biotin--[acetyl-CoA-carboxylase] ligase/biotin operon repressor BirA [Isoalcanivorax pacificus]|nr:bifunctional biotin--[acetyl-CoA-carboxylase] ligase/biotin operon repressor BirA [Isoalcanivorax pacificus]
MPETSIQVDSAVIRCLADGRFHSGEDLGALSGISRAGIWKRLQKLEQLGLAIESVRGKGYRIAGGLSLLDETALRAAAGLPADAFDLVLKETTVSTNADALAMIAGGLVRPLAVLAEYQSAGRGRRGRPWQSPFGSNLYLSLASRFSGGATALEGVSLAVGVAVADVLAASGLGARVQLKWPNDVLVGGRKLGGILVELAGEMDGVCMPVIGIGINGAMPAQAGAEIDQPWTDLGRELGAPPDRNRLAGELLASLLAVLDTFRAGGFAALRERWQQYDGCAGREVQLLLGDKRITGVACGVSEQGALLLDVEGEMQRFHGGEVSLRMA